MATELHDVNEVHSHWWPREGWQPGRLVYTWHLTFERAPQLHRLAEHYQQQLSALGGLNPIPAQWLHLTVQGIGFVDEVPSRQLDHITEAVAVRLRAFAPVSLSFHRPVVIKEAVVLAPEADEPLHQIRAAIRDGIAEITGEAQTPAEQANGFRPHVSIAYVNSPGSAAPYIEALKQAETEAITVPINEVTLIVQDRVLEPEWVYRWTTKTRIQLSG